MNPSWPTRDDMTLFRLIYSAGIPALQLGDDIQLIFKVTIAADKIQAFDIDKRADQSVISKEIHGRFGIGLRALPDLAAGQPYKWGCSPMLDNGESLMILFYGTS